MNNWQRLAVTLMLILFGMSAHASKMFRYKNEDGIEVISYTIPTDRVRYGYDIVDAQNNLIKRVEPQLSDEAYQAKLAHDKRVKECEKMRNRVRKLYQVESDIDYAEQQGLESIDQAIGNLQANLSVAESQLQEFEAQAAQMDIAGKRIPNMLLDNIERAKIQVRTFKEEIDTRFGDKLRLRDTHAYEREVIKLESCDNGLPQRDMLVADD